MREGYVKYACSSCDHFKEVAFRPDPLAVALKDDDSGAYLCDECVIDRQHEVED